MPLQKSLVQPFRKNVLLVGSGWRAFFAPYNIALGSAVASTTTGPTILDLQKNGPFDDENLPSGWFDLGWIRDFRIAPQTKIGQVRSGYRGAVRSQFKGQVGEQFEFRFREISRMAYKLATGTNPFNLLDNSEASTVGPLSGSGAQSVPTASPTYEDQNSNGLPAVHVPTGSGSLFAVGDNIVVDEDYDQSSSGVVGSAGQPIFDGAVTDITYLRKVSDFVGRIVSIDTAGGTDMLELSQKIVGGGSGDPTGVTTPPDGSNVQKIKGWAAREGGTMITEWSALFLLDAIDGAQVACYYPHVSISQFRDMPAWAIENVGATDLSGYELDCVMESLAFDDPIDGETVVGYKAFYPSTGQDIAI